MPPRKRTAADQRAELPTRDDGSLRHAVDDGLPLSNDDPPDDEFFDAFDDTPLLTMNQVVAWNLQRARRTRQMTQEELGVRLAKLTGRQWSKASVSAAESSWRGGRPRRFDANEVAAFAWALQYPIVWFFLPPEEDSLSEARFFTEAPGDVALPSFRPDSLRRLLDSRAWGNETRRRVQGRSGDADPLAGLDPRSIAVVRQAAESLLQHLPEYPQDPPQAEQEEQS